MVRFSIVIASLCLALTAQSTIYHIEIKDLESGQPLTPPVAVVHQAGYSLFTVGQSVTPGMEALAEDGLTGTLVNEANSNPQTFSAIVGGNAPTFGSFKFLVEGNPGDLLSIASMFAKTNDNFIGISAVPLPGGDSPMVIELQVYDAGTEVNSGLAAHIPAFGNELLGETENSVVTTISQYTLVDDPALGQVNFTWPPAARITITPMPDAVDYHITITGLSEGQPLTPPLIAVHDERVSLFSVGGTSSDGLELLAEEGIPILLYDEMLPKNGVWNVYVAGAGPGFEHQITITAQPVLYLSLISMFARTNDNVIGLMNYELPASGFIETIDSLVYDAGTEMNTGLVKHIPFYGNAGGPDESGVITVINSYSVLDDPSGRLDYSWPPAASIKIEAIGVQSNVENFELYQ